ncbi:alpha-scruin-like [Haemaphysalis longicornis]
MGLALRVEGEEQIKGDGRSDTELAIQTIRPCKNLGSSTTWTVLCFGGIDLHRPACHEIGRVCLCFKPTKNGWELVDMMPEPRNYHTASLVGEDVFIVGGCDPRRVQCDEMVASDSVLCFSTRSRSWGERARLPEGRAFHGAAVLRDTVYVVGGRDHRGCYLDTVAAYSPSQNCWSVLLHLPMGLMGAAVVAYEDRIWVLGGVCLEQSQSPSQPPTQRLQNEVLIVDVGLRRVTPGPALPHPLAFAAAVVCNGLIWLCGGLGKSDKGQLQSLSTVYVLQGGVWNYYDVLSLERHASAAVSFGDSFVLVLGGVTTRHPGSVDECELFYAGPNHGRLRLHPPPFPVAGHACVVVQPPSSVADTAASPQDVWHRICESANVA